MTDKALASGPFLIASGPGGWWFSPEGAAVHRAGCVAVIADVHLGYEWARGAGGDCLPAHSLVETIAKLERLLARAAIERLIVAGDLVESAAPCPRTTADVRRLIDWLANRGVALIALAGNHDPRRVPPLPATLDVAGWTIGHGHRPIDAPRTISGHHHPVIRAEALTAPCFLVGPKAIMLPAFSPNAAGWNVATQALPEGWPEREPRCLATAGAEVLDFGPLDALRVALGSS